MTAKKETHEFKFPLGIHLRDVVTGFEGHVTWRVQYMTGCDNYGLTPQGVTSEGKLKESIQFDENRLEETGQSPIILPENRKPEPKKRTDKPGGPQIPAKAY